MLKSSFESQFATGIIDVMANMYKRIVFDWHIITKTSLTTTQVVCVFSNWWMVACPPLLINKGRNPLKPLYLSPDNFQRVVQQFTSPQLVNNQSSQDAIKIWNKVSDINTPTGIFFTIDKLPSLFWLCWSSTTNCNGSTWL